MRELRRARRHADDGAPPGQGAAHELHPVSRAASWSRAVGGASKLAPRRSSLSTARGRDRARGSARGEPRAGRRRPCERLLLIQNIFFPYRPPSPAVTAALEQVTDGVYLHGDRIKVALISDVGDLGSLPSMFGRPTDYARFLGIELSLWYVGPLLVVMPAGFGVYDGGRSTATEDQVLGSLGVSGDTPDDLARAATAAVADLTAADALTPVTSGRPSSPPTRPPPGEVAARLCTSTSSTTAVEVAPSSASTRSTRSSRRSP